METKKRISGMAIVSTMLLVSLIGIAASPTTTADHNPYTFEFEGVGRWTWWDESASVSQIEAVAHYKIDLTCWGQTDCEGVALVDSGAIGSASCFIERGDSWFHGTIRVLNRLDDCRDVIHIQEGNGLTGLSGFRVVNGPTNPNPAMGGEGRGISL